ncbi:MAG: 50S ribosomal protein L19 [Bdellovibrionales bacterium]|nr:50S ribosomal protein L19 [Bdellovibrionales bacterium]
MTKQDIINGLKTAKKFPKFRVGDTVKVHVKIKEGEKERVQIFEGLVIKRRGGATKGASFIVRKISYGIGVERIFPFESAAIENIEVVKQGKVRRARLFYIREKRGKAAQVQEGHRTEIDEDSSNESQEEPESPTLKTVQAQDNAQLST